MINQIELNFFVLWIFIIELFGVLPPPMASEKFCKPLNIFYCSIPINTQ